MPAVRPCPHCGAPIKVDGAIHAGEPEPSVAVEPPSRAEQDQELDLPPVPLLAPGSHDDDYFGFSPGGRASGSEPDPNPGRLAAPSSASTSAVLEGPTRSRSAESFPAIDLAPGARPSASSSKAEEEDELAESERRPTSWPSILLASYASAVTLGLAWVLMKDRSRDQASPEPARPPVVIATSESARQAKLSRKIEPSEPIMGEHFAAMGKPLRVGDLEVTPVDVKRQGITLRRSGQFANGDRKDGGKGALVLRLKLKNTSADSVFAPLDQAYLRERGKEIVDTYVESADGERIYPFPLAVASEWSIVGQDFDALRPGESRVVAIASAPDAPPDSAGPFTWRVRLRTGINRTDTLGLRWPVK